MYFSRVYRYNRVKKNQLDAQVILSIQSSCLHRESMTIKQSIIQLMHNI